MKNFIFKIGLALLALYAFFPDLFYRLLGDSRKTVRYANSNVKKGYSTARKYVKEKRRNYLQKKQFKQKNTKS